MRTLRYLLLFSFVAVVSHPAYAQHRMTAQSPCRRADIAWTASPSSPLGPTDDYGKAVTGDARGNVYVAGTSSIDYVTIKYDSLGTRQWIARHPGANQGGWEIVAILVDPAYNVCVMGTDGLGTTRDFFVIKYNADGVEQWIAKFDSPGHGDDIATAMTLDGNGSVYVTGTAGSAGGHTGFATVKFNAAGVRQWVAQYKGDWATDDTPLD